jgi:hypothetical protein
LNQYTASEATWMGYLQIRDTAKFISIDVTNIFGRIPKKEYLTLLRNNGTKYVSIVKEIVSQNYCRFRNKFYEQPRVYGNQYLLLRFT